MTIDFLIITFFFQLEDAFSTVETREHGLSTVCQPPSELVKLGFYPLEKSFTLIIRKVSLILIFIVAQVQLIKQVNIVLTAL